MVPASLSGETWQDAEPFLTTFASNPNILAASAFTPNPGGPASTTAPIYVSDDGGNTWSLRNTLPSNVQTADITHAGGESPALYATILSAPSIALKDLETNDVVSPATTTAPPARRRSGTCATRRTTSPAASSPPRARSSSRTGQPWGRNASARPCRSQSTQRAATRSTSPGRIAPDQATQATSRPCTCAVRS